MQWWPIMLWSKLGVEESAFCSIYNVYTMSYIILKGSNGTLSLGCHYYVCHQCWMMGLPIFYHIDLVSLGKVFIVYLCNEQEQSTDYRAVSDSLCFRPYCNALGSCLLSTQHYNTPWLLCAPIFSWIQFWWSARNQYLRCFPCCKGADSIWCRRDCDGAARHNVSQFVETPFSSPSFLLLRSASLRLAHGQTRTAF